VANNKSCGDVSQERKCTDGKLSGNSKFKQASCTKEAAAAAPAALGVQAYGYEYLKDKFNKNGSTEANRFSDLWSPGACSTVPHSESSKPGSISRTGACQIKDDGSDPFVRFTVYPFDSRNTDEDSGDWGKGGGEALPRNATENAYGYATNKTGWDVGGQKYLINNNTVRYTWDFRITDISLLEPVVAPGSGVTGDLAKAPLVSAAVIGQFHSQTQYLNNFTSRTASSCGVTPEGTSPSPGIFVSSDGSTVRFRMSLKMDESLMPAYLSSAYKSNCEVQADRNGSGVTKNICYFEIWSVSLPKSDVLNKWFSVLIDTKISAGNAGSYDFYFGRKDLSGALPAAYKNQSFLGGAKTVLDSIPTKVNACPGEPRLGVYALRFNPLYYADALSLEEAIAIRKTKPREWVSNAYKKTFLSGGQNPLKAPRMTIDYDNFKITQLTVPPVASTNSSWWSNAASVFSAWFGKYPAEEI
jgi:hypothetical protein